MEEAGDLMKCPSCLKDTAIDHDQYLECSNCGYAFSTNSLFPPGLQDHGISGFDYTEQFKLRRAIIEACGDEQWTSSKSDENFLYHLKSKVEDNPKLFYVMTFTDFWLFDSWVFSPAVEEVMGKFITGDYNIFMCDLLQSFKHTMGVMPRRHSKSTKGYSWLAWQMWRLYALEQNYFPSTIFSYLPGLAGAHVENFKRIVDESENIRELGFKDEDPTAKHLGTYKCGKKEFSIIPIGMRGSVRGTNSQAAIFDDIYTDPEHPDDPRIVYKVNRALKSEMIPIVQGPYHIRGTALSEADLWFQTDEVKLYGDACQILKAINEVDIDGKVIEYALWPNNPEYDIYGLKDKQRRTIIIEPGTGIVFMFDQEFQGVPMTSTDSKWSMPTINKSIDMNLPWYQFDYDHRTWGKQCGLASGNNIATWDPGESVHPAHFAVWRIESGTWRQIASEWFDHIPYARAGMSNELTQMEIVNASRSFFGWTKLYADNTNQVLQFAYESGRMGGLIPIKISHPVRNGFLNEITKFLGTSALKLLPDERQAKQLHQIRHNGSCPTTYGPNGGHGEPLTTVGLALTGHLIEDKEAVKRTRVIKRGKPLAKHDRNAALWRF